MLFEDYGWRFCGTITPTDKKERTGEDIPFLKLSAGALAEVKCGWFREAAIELKSKSKRKYYLQCSTWRDKKQVMFLHTNRVGSSSGITVRRHVKGKRQRVILEAPQCQDDYVTYFNAVNRNDCDSSDYSTSIRTDRWYLRLFFWLLDRVIHMVYVIVCYSSKDISEWIVFCNGNGGRETLQIYLGLELINFVIEYDWKNIEDERPKWMRQGNFLPCNCGKCFFCLKGITNGMHHKPQRKVIIHHSDKSKTKTSKCTEQAIKIRDRNFDCKMCYRKYAGVDMTRDEKKAKQKTSRFGCPSCDEPICKSCWAEGYDMHHKK